MYIEHSPDHSAHVKKIDATAWGLLLLLTGVLMLLPNVPEGAWLIMAGAVLLGASALRYAASAHVSLIVVLLGILGVVAGISAIAGVDLPLFAAFLVLVGATIVFRSWFTHKEA